MQTLKSGMVDEDGMGINAVDKALKQVGLTLRDGERGFKDLDVVLEEVGKSWHTYDEFQKSQLVTAIAGVRQANILVALLDNQEMAQKLVTEQIGKDTLAQERYAEVLKGVEAAQNNLRASWEKLVMGTATSEFVADIYNLGATILNLIDSMGGLKTAIIAVAAAYVALNFTAISGVFTTALSSVSALALGLKALVVELAMATNAQIGLNIAASVNPYILLASAIAVVAGGIYLYGKNSESAAEKLSKLNDALSEQNSKIEELENKQKSINDLKDKYDSLDKTSQEFIDVQNEIKKLVPEVAGTFDYYGNFSINNTTENMVLLTGATKEQITAQKELRDATISATSAQRVQALIDAQSATEKAGSNVIRPGRNNPITPEEYDKRVRLAVAEANAIWADALANEKNEFTTWGKELQLAYIEELKKTDAGRKIAEEIFLPLMTEAQNIVESNPPVITPKLDKEQLLDELNSNSDFQDLVKQVVNMLKDIANQEKDNLKQQLSDYKDYVDTLKQGYEDRFNEEKRLYDIQKTNLQRQHEDEKRINDDRIDSIKDELNGYKKILNARQELLKIQKQEAEYNRTKADKESDLAKLEAQILEISFDNSAEGIARRLELEQQAADLRQELADDAADHEYDLQQQALDAEIAKAEEEASLRIKELEEEQKASDFRYEMRLRELEDAQDKSQQEYDTNIKNLENTYAAKEANFQDQIKLLDNYLSQEGLLNKEAMDLILDENSSVYGDLMEWNRVYGTGIQNDIISMWDLAKTAVNDYKNAIMEVSAISVPTPFPNTGGFTPYEGEQPNPENVIHAHHTGIEKGAVGGKKLQSSEEFIKVLKGEVLVTPKQMSNFTGNILPSMINKPRVENSFSNGTTFDKLFDIVIQGNLDKSVLPDLEKLSTQIIDKINKGMQQRGMLRNTNLNAI